MNSTNLNLIYTSNHFFTYHYHAIMMTITIVFSNYIPSNQIWLYYQNKKITGRCTQTPVISHLTLRNLQKTNVAKIFWFKVESWYFRTPTEIVMSVAQPIKTHIIDQSLNKSIVITCYLLSPVDHHQLTDLFSFHNHNLANQEPNTNCVTSS